MEICSFCGAAPAQPGRPYCPTCDVPPVPCPGCGQPLHPHHDPLLCDDCFDRQLRGPLTCGVCGTPIDSAELCAGCAAGNEPFAPNAYTVYGFDAPWERCS